MGSIQRGDGLMMIPSTSSSTMSIATPSPKKEKWSFSKLSSFESCERQYFYKYIEKRPYPASFSMKVGRIFHTAMETIVKEGYAPDDALRYALYRHSGLPVGERYNNLLWMIENTLERLPEDIEIASELHLTIKTTLGEVQGYADLVIDNPAEDITEIWDYKSSWASREAEDSMQLALLGWLLKELRGEFVGSVFRGRLVFPRLKEEKDTVVELTEEKLEEAKRWLVKQITKIKKKSPHDINDWNMTSNRKMCEYCPFVDLCASGIKEEGFPASGNVSTQEEAERLGAYILAQEAALKQMKQGLKKWLEKNEPVVVGNGKWFISESEPSPKCEDVRALIQYALENKLDIAEAVTAKTSTLSEWLEQDKTGKLEQLISWTSPRKTLKFS